MHASLALKAGAVVAITVDGVVGCGYEAQEEPHCAQQSRSMALGGVMGSLSDVCCLQHPPTAWRDGRLSCHAAAEQPGSQGRGSSNSGFRPCRHLPHLPHGKVYRYR